MSNIHNVVLELVRPGPAHNQLLSPLTAYIALCGGDSPVSVHFPFEHQQLLTRIQRLRYELESSAASEAQIAQRQAELQEMGKVLGEVLGEIPTLLAELNRIRTKEGKLIHLRLSLSASELGMVPFETTLSPAGFPGSGSPLFLQSHTPITITREIRRGRTLPLRWDRTPKILFAFASPPGLTKIPADEHLLAINNAIIPWVKVKDDDRQFKDELKKHLTVLRDASLQEIRDICSRENFTHVHILAHGAPFTHAGDRHFGIALFRHDDKTQWEVVDGESLAIALTGNNTTCATQDVPSVVSLATCDSGNAGSVISPGGSIAHGLHAAGIPWVFASQFPLWMKASSLAVDVLFSGLLAGEDPRSVLYDLRRRLRTDCPSTHDWASIVAYATVPPDFESQLSRFRDQQIREKLSVQLNHLDELVGMGKSDQKSPHNSLDNEVINKASEKIREILASWCNDLIEDQTQRLHPDTALRLGMKGACEKRLGLAYQKSDSGEKAILAYKSSRDYYCQAIEADSSWTWPLTQYLSMNAVLKTLGDETGRTPFGIPSEEWWFIATRLAQSEVDTPRRDFALTDLIELSLLGCIYDQYYNSEKVHQRIHDYIDKILQLEHKAFTQRTALYRQLIRYQRFWGAVLKNDLNAAINKLGRKA